MSSVVRVVEIHNSMALQTFQPLTPPPMSFSSGWDSHGATLIGQEWLPHRSSVRYVRAIYFSQSPTPGFPAAQYYLLTHAHTDHLTGLDNASTNIIIVCSKVTKGLVLNYERERDRIAFDRKTVERRKRAYEGLNARVESVNKDVGAAGHKRKHETSTTRDPFVRLLSAFPAVCADRSCTQHVIPFDVPQRLRVGYDPSTGREKWVIITMLDANHCPGSAMFLLTDPDKDVSVLHTGDIRPDRPFLDRLERHQAVMPYLAKFMGMDVSQEDTPSLGAISDAQAQGGIFKNKKLERIYLDTSAVYEEALKAIALVFGSKAAFTQGSGKRVVSIEFIEEKAVEHAIKMQEVQKECLLAMQGKGNWPTKLYCPLARHATLPELQALLDLFRPKAMSPNTLLPFLQGADFYAMIAAFGDCLAPGGKEELRTRCLRWFRKQKGMRREEEVWSFARATLLFPSAAGPSGEANDELDLRAGRNANRQRQSEAFLPTLPFATKATLNSPKADMVPGEPTIAISPSKLSRNEEDVPVFGKTDVHGYVQEYLNHQENLMDEDDQDTQVQKSREMRSERSAKSILADRGSANKRVDLNTKSELDASEPGPKRYIVYSATRDAEHIVQRLAKLSNTLPLVQTPKSQRNTLQNQTAPSSLTGRITAKSSSGILLGPKTTPAKSNETIQVSLRKEFNSESRG
ncbi:hypothetical protein QFC21_001182 [Naganishia friedmannii]|uniref:Uncharacterized protein n=1 Tax=Naganishia friedmannii TaxID=89922 RepID=A0ACC2W7U6_9TREE|nr:hypothetical protein QFC21_001182 [Naganishia friedmannii]